MLVKSKQNIIWVKKNLIHNWVIQQYQYSDNVGENYRELFKEPSFEEIKEILNDYKNLPHKIYVRDREIGYKQII